MLKSPKQKQHTFGGVMKKIVMIACMLILTVVLALSGASQSVQATNNNPGPSETPTAVVQEPGLADGDWTTGVGTSIDLSKTRLPGDLQMLGDAVTATTMGNICHPFRGGTYGWTGSIYKLQGTKWKKVNTYFMWVPDKEGTFMACTYGNMGETYALFGEYDESVNPTATKPPTSTPTRTSTPTKTSTHTRTSRPPASTQMSRQ